jgi:hypothetical protein
MSCQQGILPGQLHSGCLHSGVVGRFQHPRDDGRAGAKISFCHALPAAHCPSPSSRTVLLGRDTEKMTQWLKDVCEIQERESHPLSSTARGNHGLKIHRRHHDDWSISIFATPAHGSAPSARARGMGCGCELRGVPRNVFPWLFACVGALAQMAAMCNHSTLRPHLTQKPSASQCRVRQEDLRGPRGKGRQACCDLISFAQMLRFG